MWAEQSPDKYDRCEDGSIYVDHDEGFAVQSSACLPIANREWRVLVLVLTALTQMRLARSGLTLSLE